MRVLVRSRTAIAVLTSIAAAAALVVAAPTTSAEPRRTIEQVEAQLEALENRAESASEAVNEAQVELARINAKLKVAQAQVKRALADVAAQTAAAGAMAREAYMSGSSGMESSFGLLLADNPTNFLEKATAVQQAARRQSATLRNAQTAQLRLAQAEARVAQQQAAAAKVTATLKSRRAEINAAVAETQKVLSSLQAEERARLAAKAAAERAAAASRAAAARRAAQSSAPSYDGPASGRAAVAVRYALAQVGEPYSYNANPPSSWDCSKLTAAAWRAAGVSLTALSYAQANQTRRISTSDLQPGDLLFYFRGAHHVSMYIGGGRIVEAASPGRGVIVSDLWNSWNRSHFSFAGRVVG
jgi:cell wall-associated NlpC family hydrolase